jgi:hypothetical protein
MKNQKRTVSNIITGARRKSRGGARLITKSLVTLKDRAAANMAAMKYPAASCEVSKSIFSPLNAADYNYAPRGVEFDP